MHRTQQTLLHGQTNKKKAFRAAILLTILTTVLTCCTTSQNIRTPAPHVNVPDPVDESGQSIVVYDESADIVKMPLWYWEKLTDYIIDTQAVQEIYENDYKGGGK